MSRLCSFDEDSNEWILPSLTVERTVLPPSVNVTTTPTTSDDFTLSASRVNSGRVAGSSRILGAALHDPEAEREEEARLYAKLASRSQNHTKYFTNKRKEQLLLDAGNHFDNCFVYVGLPLLIEVDFCYLKEYFNVIKMQI